MPTPAPDLDLQWTPWLTDPDRRDAHCGDDRLTVAPGTRGLWTWSRERILSTRGESVVARAYGEAPGPEDAQRAAARYRFDEVDLIHDHPDGAITHWVGGHDRPNDPTHITWTATLAGDGAQVHRSASLQNADRPWFWSRQCACAAPIFALCGGRLHGYAHTQELAMIAAIEAPDQLCRAAAIFLVEYKSDREPL